MQIFHNPEWKQSESPVCDHVETGDGENKTDEDIGVQASSIVGVQSPERSDRVALEQENEEQNWSEKHGQDHDHSDDPYMEFVGRDSEQKVSNADFEKAGRQDVEDLAEEPVLPSMLA